jgi:hypothetical protein
MYTHVSKCVYDKRKGEKKESEVSNLTVLTVASHLDDNKELSLPSLGHWEGARLLELSQGLWWPQSKSELRRAKVGLTCHSRHVSKQVAVQHPHGQRHHHNATILLLQQ